MMSRSHVALFICLLTATPMLLALCLLMSTLNGVSIYVSVCTVPIDVPLDGNIVELFISNIRYSFI